MTGSQPGRASSAADQRRAISRNHILDAVEQVFAQHGSTTRRCGRSPKMPSSTSARCTRSSRARTSSTASAATAAAPGSCAECARCLRGGAIAPPLAEPEQDADSQDTFRASLALQSDLFARGQRCGEMRDRPPALLARMFFGIVAVAQSAELDERAFVEPDASTGALHAASSAAFGGRGPTT